MRTPRARAWRWKASTGATRSRARGAGLALDEVALARQFESKDESEAALLRYLRAVLEQGGRPAMHLHEEAREAGWDDEQILEAIADPWVSAAWQTSNTEFYAVEVGDPVEEDKLGYKIGGVLVSDFILPAWFVKGLKVPKYDFAGHLKAPLQIAPGGYASVFTSGKGWKEKQMRKGRLVAVKRDPDDARFRDRSKSNVLH